MKMIRNLLWFVFILPSLCFASPSQVDFLLSGFSDSNGDPLSGGKVYTYIAGTTTNKTTWSNITGTSAHANPIILDSNGTKQVFADGLYKFVVTDSADVVLYTFDNLSYGVATGVTTDGGTSSGAANTYAITVSPSPVSYATGQKFSFISHQANTSAATLNVNSIGAVAITSKVDQALVGSEVPSGAVIAVMYDGDSFRIIDTTPLPRISQAYSASADSVSSSTYATMTGATVTVSVKTGDYVKINWWASWSVDNVDSTPQWQIHEGSTAQASTLVAQRSTGDVGSGGDQRVVSGSYVYTSPTAGSTTYTLKWKRSAGANVCYSAYRYISAEVISP